MTTAPALRVEDLRVTAGHDRGARDVVRGVSFDIATGEALGLVGESGSGKSMTIRSIIGLLPPAVTMTGVVRLGDLDVTGLTEAAMRRVRGDRIGVVFQDPRSHINPLRTVGDFLVEQLVTVRRVHPGDAMRRAEALLLDVGISDASRRLRQRPYELSGGLLQRVMIASVLLAEPDVVLADEPTTALDTTIQEEVMAILDEERRKRDLAMLFVSHDLDLAGAVCDHIAVMKDGVIVERLPASAMRTSAREPYTTTLMNARPHWHTEATVTATDAGQHSPAAPSSPPDEALLDVHDLRKVYRVRKAAARGHDDLVAVDSASFSLPEGGSLAIVGESGSGKTTLARMLVGLTSPTSGEIRLDGRPVSMGRLSTRQRRQRGRALQMVFQDPYSSLDRRQTVGSCLSEVLRLHTSLSSEQRRRRVAELVEQVGLPSRHAEARPRSLSGGERQRVAIARALAAEPRALVLDEAVSALDVSIQAQVLALLERLRRDLGVALLFISHDLPVVRRLCDDVVVMHRGLVVECGLVLDVLAAPRCAYTQRLIDSVPRDGWRPRRRGRDGLSTATDLTRSS
ncbi:dipeptide ABC transporter ATP-binding protein [Haloechinothrix halophila]|uniref:dipeptide ABC transporter ATP-binding protein n=1 Tax=Haloechinothrix halophila TaxID=1069073 RepID=UPI0003FA1525|nr:ABC transporter ATP-binding protein [Haloechinothrix halophila]